MTTSTSFLLKLIFLFSIGAGAAFSQNIVYVDNTKPPGGSGLSWNSAFNDLQTALNAAAVSGNGIQQIWVRTGLYKPDGGSGNKAATFKLVTGVAIYGGFTGTEVLLSERDWTANGTVLSGDLLSNDSGSLNPSDVTYSDNCYHVVTGTGTGAGAILDGFSVMGGVAQGAGNSVGGGLYSKPGNPILRNCNFMFNIAGSGAGINAENGGSLTIEHCTFTKNAAMGSGGGIAVNTIGNLTILDSFFSENVSNSDGGAIHCAGANLILQNTIFQKNTAGAVFSAEGGALLAAGSSVQIYACQFLENIAHEGAAIYCNEIVPAFAMSNCLFSNNKSKSEAAVFFRWPNENFFTIDNCKFFGNRGFAAAVSTGARLTISNSTFDNNGYDPSVSSRGGTLRIIGWTSLINCSVKNGINNNGYGGLMICEGRTTATGCEFSGGYTNWHGGAIAVPNGPLRMTRCIIKNSTAALDGGGIWADAAGTLKMRINECELISNSATKGGGIFHRGLFAPITSQITSTTIAGNTATGTGGGVHSASGSLMIDNCIISNNSDSAGGSESSQLLKGTSALTVQYSCIQGWTGALGGIGNFGSNPLFKDLPGGDVNLSKGSPAIDAGNPAFAFPLFDLGGNARITDGNLDGQPRIDPGAREFTNVRLSLSGDASAGGIVTCTMTTEEPMFVTLFMSQFPDYQWQPFFGYIFFDPSSAIVSVLPHGTTSPAAVTFQLPSNSPFATHVVLQAFGVGQNTIYGNTSNPLLYLFQ
ncbi:MAG: right-handed parallel beta-helix repeat-containing protein [Planctomycetota bacterium]